MCGIVGGIAKKNIVPILMEGLTRLEYRGYDSAGVAIIKNKKVHRIRSVGRVSQVSKKLEEATFSGDIGIGHTRWATHGKVTENNAHPHISRDQITLVHNGIIENYEEEKSYLQTLGYQFESQTDTEVIAHLIHHYHQDLDLYSAVKQALSKLKGAFAIAVMSITAPKSLIVARLGCPLLIGLSDDGHFIASDISALLSITRQIIYLEDGDIAELSQDSITIHDVKGDIVQRKIYKSDVSLASMELGHYAHYMQKEIYEQPRAINDTIEAVMGAQGFSADLFGESAKAIFQHVESILILAAGTSYYAGMVAKYWIETISSIPTSVEIASEYRYRDSVPHAKQLVVCISQSGETLDTMEALKQAKHLKKTKNMPDLTLAICNVMESQIPRTCRFVFYTRAGVEISVASTKSVTTQLAALFLLAGALAKEQGTLTEANEHLYLNDLRCIATEVQHSLNLEPLIIQWAKRLSAKKNALFLGRGALYPIALEGALKLKEISYIHAEAYPAGELKHGPLALVDKNMPVIVIAPSDALLEKIKSNIQEVAARGGELFILTDVDSHLENSKGVHIIKTARPIGILSPILYSIPVQLLAYHTALFKGTDVDKPRNLAKSVTVE